MGLLRLAVLGTPEVFHDGRRLTFALRKAQALLVYLAVEGGMHPRGKLATFLWLDSESHDARHALRIVIALLRNLLDDAEGQEPHLLSQRDALGLNPQAPLELDLEVVQQAHHQAQEHSTTLSEEQRAAQAVQLQSALPLFPAPFPHGFSPPDQTSFDAS